MTQQDRLLELLRRLYDVLAYDHVTGIFRWKVKINRRIVVGGIAGYVAPDGYRYITIDGECYLAHRLVWFYIFHYWPIDQVDHCNGIRDDNRLINLRDVPRSWNNQNQRNARSTNKSKFLGVCVFGKRFKAQLKVNGKTHYLGLFDNAEIAHKAYISAKNKLHPGSLSFGET